MATVDGRVTPKLTDTMTALVHGGVGLIISGYAFVRWDGKQAPGQMGIYSDSFNDQLKAMAKAVHDEGGRICVQIVHCGGQSSSETIGMTPIANFMLKHTS